MDSFFAGLILLFLVIGLLSGMDDDDPERSVAASGCLVYIILGVSSLTAGILIVGEML